MVVKVIKSDGAVEEYLHTKVLLSVTNALEAACEWDGDVAQELAGAVTTHIYERSERHIRSSEILSMILEVLRATGFDEAAARFEEHHHSRNLGRRRTEVVDAELSDAAGAESIHTAQEVSRWSKNAVAEHIMRKYGLERDCARAAAGRVEEKVLAMGMSRVWSGLVRQLAAAEAAAVIKAREILCQTTEPSGASRNEISALE